MSLAKNNFLALPCYLVLWVFSLSSLATAMNLAQAWKNRLSWLLLSAGVFYAGFLGVAGSHNLPHWPAKELQEGPHNRIVMREMAADLRTLLSDDDRFMWMPAYGNPVTLLYYMSPSSQGKLPEAIGMDAMIDPPPEEYVRKIIEPAKAVLVFRGDIPKKSFYVHPANLPYFQAIAAWIRRPGGAHHLLKSYQLLQDDNPGQELTVDLYMKGPTPINALQELQPKLTQEGPPAVSLESLRQR